jgi:hypothetical protein
VTNELVGENVPVAPVPNVHKTELIGTVVVAVKF